MLIIKDLKKFFQLPPGDQIKPEVRENFKRNFINNSFDGAFWLLGESFVSMNTILPVFASTLTTSAVLIGLVPALVHAGWLLPQLLFASYVQRLPQKLPFAKTMALIERIPYLILPLTALMLRWVTNEVAIWLFMAVVAWRGAAGGMVALPWQEVIASVIPSEVRSRFFGVSRTMGRILGIFGAVVAGFILARLSYPDNFALSFLIGAIFIWVSYFFFSRTIEPKKQIILMPNSKSTKTDPLIDIAAFKKILKLDLNFRNYLTSRVLYQLGSMASGFLAVYGIQRFSLPDEQVAIFTGLLFASGVLGFSIWGVFGDRLGPRKVLLISDFVQVCVLALVFFARSVWAIYLVFLLFGFAQSGFIIGDLILGMELGAEEERPIYLGLARSIPGIFVLIAPLIGGTLVDWVGYPAMFLVALVFTLSGIYFLLHVKDRNQVLLTS